jgi:hypothetical protein
MHHEEHAPALGDRRGTSDPAHAKAKLGGVPIAIGLPKNGQLLDLGVAFLDLSVFRSAELIHLGLIFSREDLLLLGQPLLKL